MNRYPNPLDPEDLEHDLCVAYPGLPEGQYQDIAYEALNPSAGRSRGREWAMTAARLALLEKTRRDDARDESSAWND